jgi:hypothetical protein
MLNFIDFLKQNSLEEGNMAKKWIYRLKSIISGNTRRRRIGREFAAFDQPLEKSVGLKPRQQKTFASKTNASLLTQEFEHNSLNEAYDSFNVVKAAGYGTFMTARDLGIKIKAGFEHHPTVEEAIEEIEEKKNDKRID